MILKSLRRLVRDRRGNVAMMFAISLLPMVFLGGMAIDYTMASDKQAQLNGYADAAALSAVTPTMMAQSNSTAKTTATNTFNAQASALSGISYSPSNLSVNITTNSGGTRTATVSYTASYPTFFASLLGVNQINLGGSSTANGGLPPNINFYLLLEDSPSMALAATSAGVQSLINATQYESDGSGAKGCAFACHEYEPSQDGLSKDNYAVARGLGLTLRIDLVSTAAQNLMTTATTTMANNNASYQMAIYTFDVTLNTIQTLTSSMTKAAESAKNIQVLEVCYNNRLSCSGAGAGDNDMDSDFDQAMYKINKIMPNPGSGTNTKGDTPQEVLFIVTDGVEDACESPAANPTTDTNCREQYYMDYVNGSGNTYAAPGGSDWCSTIKNRGIR
ncbi:MAG TPA: TadE/TadG family type IV pilus assembly protein, partial [Stellaceae bacterium]|nr:TadE/TadG family type IV pilus assembly protein [Stellaceae bacterium]